MYQGDNTRQKRKNTNALFAENAATETTEDWLVSYSDLMTLLLTFFVLFGIYFCNRCE